MTSILWILAGLAVLTVGAEALVRGASRVARVVGVPPLIIGLTVVAFGTSAPEFAVSVKAGLAGQGDLSLGNVVGSNVFNVLLILGLSATIAPLSVSSQLVRLDVPVMIAVSVLIWGLAIKGFIGPVEGAALVAGLCAYTGLLIFLGKRKDPGRADDGPAIPEGSVFYRLGLPSAQVLCGLGLLILGADWLVHGAVNLARLMQVSELLIGLTIVATGTSVPELATSIVASLRGEREIAVGNVVGSNIFNLLGVLGFSAMVSEGGIRVAETAIVFDIPVMVAVAVACLPIFFTGGRISRWEGALFLAYYAAYIAFLILAGTQNAAKQQFATAMLWYAIPLTVLGISLSVALWLRRTRSNAGSTQ
jgi:cation:H+ antiporter